jgi:hypothetical protein
MIINQPPVTTTPGLTSSGIASGRQLVELTTATGLLLDKTAAPRPLVILQGSPVAALTLEEAADELDRDIARKRIAEIEANPEKLIRGATLEKKLKQWQS